LLIVGENFVGNPVPVLVEWLVAGRCRGRGGCGGGERVQRCFVARRRQFLLAETKLQTPTIRSVADQSAPPDRSDLGEPDLHLDFADCVFRLLRVDLALEGVKLYDVVPPSI